MSRVSVLLCSLLLAGVSSAQIPTAGNVFFGYSYYNTNFSPLGRTGLNGWQGTLEGRVLPGVGIVADFGGHYGSVNDRLVGVTCPVNGCPTVDSNAHLYDFLFGPRFSATIGRFRPFAEFEFGAAHITANSLGSATSFSIGTGGGLDYRIIRPVAWRVQADFVSTHFFSQYQSGVRVATGIVARF